MVNLRNIRPLFSSFGLAFALAVLASAPSANASSRTGKVSVTVSPATVNSGGSAVYTIKTSKVNSTAGTAVNFAMSGSAALGQDYTLNSASNKAVIPSGASSVAVVLSALPTSSDRTASMTLKSGSGYGLSSSLKTTITIKKSLPPAPTPTPTPSPTPTPTPSPTPTPFPTATPTPTPFVGPTPRPTPSREMWIALRSDGLVGSGTQADPYDGSSAARFDAAMRSIPTDTVIHIGAGTFLTNGFQDYSRATKGFIVKNNWKVMGAGLDVTVVRLMSLVDKPPGYTPNWGSVFCTGWADTSDTLVSDLTIDCNAQNLGSGTPGGTAYTAAGIELNGNNCTIRNLHLIHAYGNWASRLECFAISIGGWSDGYSWHPSYNALIENCLADTSTLDYGVAIQLASDLNTFVSGTVRGCTVKDWVGTSAYGILGRDCVYEYNSAINCTNFLRNDSGTVQNCVFRNNTAIGCDNFFDFIPCFPESVFHDIVVENNQMVNRRYGATFFGTTSMVGPGHVYNFTVRNNTANSDNGQPYHPYYVYYSDNVVIYDNQFDGPKIAWYPGPDATNLQFPNEDNQTGTFASALRLTGTYGANGYLWYAYPGTYTIGAGDHLEYDVFCAPNNASFSPDGLLFFTDLTDTRASFDQWGIPVYLGDVRAHAANKWFSREIDLTPYVGKTTSDFRFGDTAHIAGSITHYWNNVRIVDSTGAVKKYFYNGTQGQPNLVLLNSTAVNGVVVSPISVTEKVAKADAGTPSGTQTINDASRGVFDFSVVRTDSGSLLDATTNRVTSSASGTMMITWTCGIQSVSPTGYFLVEISKNGNPVAFSYIANANAGNFPVRLTDSTSVGDYYTCTVYNATGSPLVVSQDPASSFVEARFYPSFQP